MSHEIFHKLKKILVTSVLLIVGLSVFLIISIILISLSGKSGGNKASLSTVASYGIGRGSGFLAEDSMMKREGTVSSPLAPENSQTTSVSSGSDVSPIIERKLMQDGSLSLVVRQVEAAVSSLTNVAQNLGGRIDDVQYSNAKEFGRKRAVVTLRVPSVNFDSAMTQAKQIALAVESENISTRDVTEQFIDMQARLKNLKAEEEQYQQIMQKTTDITDTLEVSQYLFDTRQQIEQLQGQMNYLSRQVDMSVITISLSSDPDIDAANIVWNPMTTVKGAVQYFIRAFYWLIDAIIWGVLSFLPLVVVFGGIAFLFVWIFIKFLRPWYHNIKDFFHF
ncbi:MAG: DUF4349 domain-containing protein [Candidatus Parcubacteria bacterium]|nr:DUF4349 domain-containing protein [Candidatus Parcubacteria bacterium]